MANYDLERLGHEEFEHLAQALLKKIIGFGTITFGDGPDGGREATFHGKAPYPSIADQWDGTWVFQAKFHQISRIGPDTARREIMKDLKNELEKIVFKYKRQCQNYILITNVPLSSVAALGTHDKISEEIIPDFSEKIPHIHVWGYDDLARFIDNYADVRRAYLHLITPGDLIAELMDRGKPSKSQLAETVLLYVRGCFENEQYALLDQAGEINEKPLQLRRVFIDLFVRTQGDRDYSPLAERRLSLAERIHERTVLTTELLMRRSVPRALLIGGPGQGKSTLGQFVAQIHRAYLLDKTSDLGESQGRWTPFVVRVPFRVILRDFVQWIVDSKGPYTMESFLAGLMQERAGRQISADQVQEVLKANPSLLVLDGLDEVTDRALRARMLGLLMEFLGRCDDVLKADLQVLATSRPTEFGEEFDPSHFMHLSLVDLDKEKVAEYTEKWIRARGLDTAKGNSLRLSMQDCLTDQHFSQLMTTILQVTIFILIILNGGTPPRQREELFDEYLEIIYKTREIEIQDDHSD